jgi:hypothetical protein
MEVLEVPVSSRVLFLTWVERFVGTVLAEQDNCRRPAKHSTLASDVGDPFVKHHRNAAYHWLEFG